MKKIYFERAIFLSWYCSKGDCQFCYMSTQKNNIKNPLLAKRRKETILAEVILCKIFDWKIEFISGGYDSYEPDDLYQLIKDIKEISGQKLWLNIGIMSEQDIIRFKPLVKGISGPVECINPKLRNTICPSKPLKEIENMFDICTRLDLKKSITIILGLGETVSDFHYLKDFITKNTIDQVTFYRLKPQKDTHFENAIPITKEYYSQWIKMTRDKFPTIKIIAGSWLDHLDEISLLLQSGADGITKFPIIKKFNSVHANTIVDEVKKANMQFMSNITKKVSVNLDKETESISEPLRQKVKNKLKMYLDSI